MAAYKIKLDVQHEEAKSIETPFNITDVEFSSSALSAAASPALALQHRLRHNFDQGTVEILQYPRYPGLLRFGIIAGGATCLWAAIFKFAALFIA